MKWRRVLFPLAALLLAAAVVTWFGTRLSSDPTPLPGALAKHSEIVQREDMFRLGTAGPLRFELHAGFHAVEVVANGALQGGALAGSKEPGELGGEAFSRLRGQPEGATVFALETRFEKDDGTWTLWAPYSLESMARFFVLPEGKGVVTSREHFPLAGPGVVSLEDAYLRFQTQAGADSQWPELPPRARTLEIRVSPSLGLPPWCDAVLLRVAGVSHTPGRKLSYLWERLSSVDQKSLSYVSSLGERGLDDGQKKALLAEHRLLLAPDGMDVMEKARVSTLVHRNVKLPTQPVRDVVRFDVADARHVLALRLGEARQHVRLGFSPEPVSASAMASARDAGTAVSRNKVTVLWEGLRPGEVRSEEITVGSGSLTDDGIYSEGTLYVQADSPVRVVASEVKSPGVGDDDPWIVPVPSAAIRSDAFALLPTEPLRYEFAPARDSTLEVRVDVRARLDTPKTGAKARIRLLRAGGAVAGEEAIDVPAVASRFDSLTDAATGSVGVTDAVSRYVVVPPGVTALEVLGDEGLLASAYSRPRALPKLGAHISASLALQSERAVASALETASWFAVRPSLPVVRVESPSKLHVQPVARSFAPTPSGAWEEARTRVPGPTRKVVVPRFSELKEDVALPSSVGTEMILVGGRAQARVRFLEDPLAAGVSLFHRLSRTPVEALVRVDGTVVWRGFLPFQQGESRLPTEPLARYLSGRDQAADVVVETRSPGVEGRFVLAGAVPVAAEGTSAGAGSALWSIREVQPVPRGSGRDFVLRKIGPQKEVHSGVFLPVADNRAAPGGLSGSMELSLESVPGFPVASAFPPLLRFFPGFTFAKRRVEFQVPSDGLHPLIGTETGLLTEGVPFVFVLDEDLPVGDHVVRLRNTSGFDAYAYFGTVRAQAPRAARLVTLPRDGAIPSSGPKGPPAPFATPAPFGGPPLIPTAPGVPAACIPRLLPLVELAMRGGRYSPPSDTSLAAIESAFEETLRAAAVSPALKNRWATLGFDVELLEPGCRNPIWIVREMSYARRGRGFYAIRKGSGLLPYGVQAPHADTDLNTGVIASHLFAEHPLAVAAFNTVPREQIDFSHTYVSVFQSFMRAASGARRGFQGPARSGFIQLHGFDAARRDSPIARSADVILGDGKESPDEYVESAAEALNRVAKARTRVYARDVGELGGTRNVQGRLLRTLDAGLFLHVELSLAERERLATDALRRRTFLSALLHGLESGSDR